MLKWLVSCEITWLGEQADPIWKTELEGWHPLKLRFNEVGESLMHANAIKLFESEHWIPSHNTDSSSWTWHWASQWSTVVHAHWEQYPHPWSNYPTIHWSTAWRANFVASLLLQIYRGLLNFIIEVLEMKLIFFEW